MSEAPADIVDVNPVIDELLRSRCDACTQPAYVLGRVNGTNLTYCVHHGTLYLDKLRAASDFFVDARHLYSCE